MRKIKLLIYSCLLGISALPVQAKVITQSQAQALAAKYVSVGNGSKQQTFSAARKSGQKDAPSFYAFNDSKGKGFVLIAGDDCVNPILGYSPSGKIDTDNLPPALEAWLQDVSSYINSKRESGNGMAMTASDAEQGSTPSVVVAPLIKTKWYQMAPYSDMTPTVNGEHCLTGCVATGMAQVMNYYKWPKKGTNSVKYDTPDYDQKTCDIDFTQSVYDWDNMLNVYGTRSEPDNFTCSEANRKAVAQLMRDAGAAVHMEYGTEGSGANGPDVVSAATYYFGYDAQMYNKNDYTMKQWVSLIETNLDNGCPLVYCGDTKWDVGKGSESHCFVIDGYDSSNYLHVNWGWAGDCDGYYYFYKFGANPSSYYSTNMTFIKMTPNKTGVIEWDASTPLRLDADKSYFYSEGLRQYNNIISDDVTKLNADLDLWLIALTWNIFQGEIQLGYTAQNGDFIPLVDLKDTKIEKDIKGFTQQRVRFHIANNDIKDLPDGSYQLTIRSKLINSGISVNGAPFVLGISDASNNLVLVKNNGKVSISSVLKPIAHLTAKTPLMLDKNEYDITDMPTAKIQISNETDLDFSGKLKLIVTDTEGNTVVYDEENGEQFTLFGGDSDYLYYDIPIYAKTGFHEGTVKVSLGQTIDGEVVPLKGIKPTTIKVNRNEDKIPVLEAENIEIDNDGLITNFDNILLDYDVISQFSADFKCRVQNIPQCCCMDAKIIAVLDDGKEVGEVEDKQIMDVSQTYNLCLDIANLYKNDVGKNGTISILYTPMFDTKMHYVKYNGKDAIFKFKVIDTATGIKDVTSGNKASEVMRFDVMGRRISTPAKGLNLIKMSDGTVKKVIVK